MDTAFAVAGYAMFPGALPPDETRRLTASLGEAADVGRRGMLAHAEVARLATSAKLLALVQPRLSADPRPVRAIIFNKTPAANWFVAWHQDLTIAVRERRNVAGFGPWSEKEGIPHVQPPVELLERMAAVRIHLDAADETNGALRVLPGTHLFGRISPERIEALRREIAEVSCSAAAGDVLLMRPLLLHASGRAIRSANRRVLHIEYADFALPQGLRWNPAA